MIPPAGRIPSFEPGHPGEVHLGDAMYEPASKGRGEHRPAHPGKDPKTMILVDPLREGNSRCPLSVSPYYFQNPVRAQEMERISFAGQHIGREESSLAEDHVQARCTGNNLQDWCCSSSSKSGHSPMIRVSVWKGSSIGSVLVTVRVHAFLSQED